jgi:hypothetical protein
MALPSLAVVVVNTGVVAEGSGDTAEAENWVVASVVVGTALVGGVGVGMMIPEGVAELG